MNLTDSEKAKIIELIQSGKPLPLIYKSKLFNNNDVEFIEATRDYRLVYKGKARKEEVLSQTPIAPFQKIRSFNSDNSHNQNWQNMLIFGDNLLALKTIYEDQKGENKFKTKNKIKLIYIDPPFSTKQDFMKDREKAYRDKIIGAEFIEFLRKRLFFLKEILADDGSLYVHLDWKKGHYIKAILDEVFGEHNFVNEIIWAYKEREMSKDQWNRKHDNIYMYSKSSDRIFNWKDVSEDYSEYTLKNKFNHVTEDGRRYRLRYKDGRNDPAEEDENTYRQYLDESGVPPRDWWLIPILNQAAKERQNYPTQKSEKLLERIIRASSNEGDIVLDAFAGSGTTLAVSEKLGRNWIGIDCGKLSIYTIQKRMLNLTNHIGSIKNDERTEFGRIPDLENFTKSNHHGLLMLFEKVNKGQLTITDSFIVNLADFISKFIQPTKKEKFLIVCPAEKIKLNNLKPKDNIDIYENFDLTVNDINFHISIIQPIIKPDKEKPLRAKKFTLYNAGVYDTEIILDLEWHQYKSFVSQLFNIRLDSHKIHCFQADGYIGVSSAFIWDYPNQKNLIIDVEYIKSLHHVLGGKAGERFYIIAPIIAMSFLQDEIEVENTKYVLLKVPLSVLKALIEKGEPGSIKQPISESDVNEVIDAIGFDFISQPKINAFYKRIVPINQNMFELEKKDYSIDISTFKSDTLIYDVDDFENFETLSMVLVDTNYNDDYFNLSKVFWATDIVNKDKSRAVINIPEDEFIGDKLMIIFIDKYGNELKVLKSKGDFK